MGWSERVEDWVLNNTLGAIGVATLCTVVAILFLVVLIVRVDFPGQMAAFEQLRIDIKKVGSGDNEDVVGQATEANQALAARKRYNAIWWADIFVVDAWDEVDPIEIPEAR